MLKAYGEVVVKIKFAKVLAQKNEFCFQKLFDSCNIPFYWIFVDGLYRMRLVML